MKNKKAICALILAVILTIIAIVFKENMPKIMHYGICFLGIGIAGIAVHLEKRKK